MHASICYPVGPGWLIQYDYGSAGGNKLGLHCSLPLSPVSLPSFNPGMSSLSLQLLSSPLINTTCTWAVPAHEIILHPVSMRAVHVVQILLSFILLAHVTSTLIMVRITAWKATELWVNPCCSPCCTWLRVSLGAGLVGVWRPLLAKSLTFTAGYVMFLAIT